MEKIILEKYINDRKSTYDISKEIGKSPSTIRYWLNKYKLKTNTDLRNPKPKPKVNITKEYLDNIVSNNIKSYSYLYGLYLGDGCVYKRKYSSDVTFTLDDKYPLVISKCMKDLEKIFNKPPTLYSRNNSTNVRVSSKLVDYLFIKYRKGYKYLNKVYLPDTLEKHIDHINLTRGLIHSDGSYYFNNNTNVYCYSFTNKSLDIINILSNSLDYLDVKYSFSTKTKGGCYQILIQSKKESKKLLGLIGNKNNMDINR